jgi:hypothetical protein
MKERIETLDRIIDETKRIEVVMDIVNCDYGTQKEFCIFCKSDKYNSKVGIVHKENCEIIRMRKISKIKRSDENGD